MEKHRRELLGGLALFTLTALFGLPAGRGAGSWGPLRPARASGRHEDHDSDHDRHDDHDRRDDRDHHDNSDHRDRDRSRDDHDHDHDDDRHIGSSASGFGGSDGDARPTLFRLLLERRSR